MFNTPVALLLCALRSLKIQAQVVAGSSATVSTCPHRSINYITHSLPQQCLATTWLRKASADAATLEDLQNPTLLTATAPGTRTTTIVISTPSLATATESTKAASVVSGSTDAPSPTVETQEKPEIANEADQESESPLDNANFLSFEDWKRQNLAKAGQSTENLGARAGGNEARRRPGGINNALDSLGEDTEIEIDFGGFVSPGTSAHALSAKSGTKKNHHNAEGQRNDPTLAAEEATGVRRRGKDAGKTCKERSNYASFDCAATVLKTNSESKGSTAVLVENKDSYMLNTCSAKNKFLIVELCDDILIDTVVLANFEFFSSMFRTFKVSVSDRYPVKLEKWKQIGTFEAKNSREVQAFLVENPLIWARYLRLEFVTHFGNEYYCPVSLLRVHGTTMMEEFNHDLKRSGVEEENDGDIEENEGTEDITSTPGVVSAEALKEQAQQTSKQADGTSTHVSDSAPQTAVVDSTPLTDSQADGTEVPLSRDAVPLNAFATYNFSISNQLEQILSASDEIDNKCKAQDEPHIAAVSQSVASISTKADQSLVSSTIADANKTVVSSAFGQVSPKTATESTKPADGSNAPIPENALPENKTQQSRPLNQTSASAIKPSSSSTQLPPPNPTTQESFFKSVHKRLQLLESNSTLSLQYIEEQSRILREAFSKVEKRQLAKTTTFLETLNTTVLTELRDFRNQYDQIWQLTVLELSSQREQSQHEVLALSARLSLLADEVVLQKRIAILQFLLILLCLGLAIFSRSGPAAPYPDLPLLVQNAVDKSSVALARYGTQFETPPASPSTRPSSRYGLFRGLTGRSSPSQDSQPHSTLKIKKSRSAEGLSPNSIYQNTSANQQALSPEPEDAETSSDGSPQAKADSFRQTKSSPATPGG